MAEKKKKPPKKEEPKETFPKIAAEAKLKKVVMCDTSNLVFHDLTFGPDQYAQLERWRKNGDIIRVTLEQAQGQLPGM